MAILSIDDYLGYTKEVYDLGFYSVSFQTNKYLTLDSRNTFFGKVAGTINVYNIGLSTSISATKMAELDFKNMCPPEYNQVFHILDQVTFDKPRDLIRFFSILRVNVITGTWVAFESSLTAIFKKLATPSEVEKLEQKDLEFVFKRLASKKLSEESINEIKQDKKIIKRLTNQHISLPDKINFILKKYKDKYPSDRDIDKDKAFLDFYGFTRNTTHSNGISFATRKFDTSIGIFEVEKDSPVNYVTPENLLKMVKELIDIYKIFIDLIECDDIIIDSSISPFYFLIDGEDDETDGEEDVQ